MAHEIIVPPFGESITECTIAEWLKADGDIVRKGEDIAVIDSEKASTEIQAEVSGRLSIRTAAGEDVPVGAVIGTIDESAAGAEESAPAPKAEPKPAAKQEAEPAKAAAKPVATAPSAPKAEAAPEPPAAAQPAAAKTEQVGERPERRVQMSRLRRTIAARLLQAKQQTAMLSTFAEVDMSAIMDLRRRHQDAFLAKAGIKLGIMSFFVKAAVEALKAIPEANASIEDKDIVYHDYYDISVAVSTEKGLVVPVIRDADTKSFGDIEKELVSLAKRARSGELGMDELSGGTFTITNGGVFGSMLSTPLLNPPQVGILGMHSIEDRPVAIEGRVEIRPMMYLALSYDHRLIDGKDAVRFLGLVKAYAATPERMMLGL